MSRRRQQTASCSGSTQALSETSGGFVFLGSYLRVVRSYFTGRTCLFRWPSPASMKSLRARVKEPTDRRRRAGMRDIEAVIADLNNPVLRGWSAYFRTGNASPQFIAIEHSRSSASRVREVRTHGLNGGHRNPDPTGHRV